MKRISGEYRGISWESLRDLSLQLGCSFSTASSYLNNKKCSAEDFIDFRLGTLTYEEYCRNYFTKNRAIYRGITFRTEAELIRKLLVSPTALRGFIERNPGKTYTDYIDFRLKDSTYEEYLENNGVGYFYHKGYKYRFCTDLAEQLGVSKTAITDWVNQHPDSTMKNYIDFFLEKRNAPRYRGVPYRTQKEVADFLGVSRQAVNQWMARHPNKDLTHYIDHYFKYHTQKNEISNKDFNPMTDSPKKKEYYAITTSMLLEETVLVPVDSVEDIDEAIDLVVSEVEATPFDLLNAASDDKTKKSFHADEKGIFKLSEEEAAKKHQIIFGKKSQLQTQEGFCL